MKKTNYWGFVVHGMDIGPKFLNPNFLTFWQDENEENLWLLLEFQYFLYYLNSFFRKKSTGFSVLQIIRIRIFIEKNKV